MDGNRGAKGSIRDRLISLLYRIRYAKKVKKEEEYEIYKKEKQVEYLKKLINLKETKNVDILNSEDKKELEKVKFTATYKLNNNKFSLNKKSFGVDPTLENSDAINKKQIDIADFNLTDIEQKTSELDSKVELKEEIKKTNNEIVILKEVEKFVKKSKDILEEINIEVESLKKISKDKNQNTEELDKRYIKLKEKVEKLKRQYETVKDKYDLSEFSILESIKLIDNIKDYKDRASLNEMEMMIKVCKKEITKIESVTIEYVETKKVGANIDNIKSDQKTIKVKFNKSKEEINKIKNIEEELNRDIKDQEEIIDDMYKEASYLEKITKKEVNYINKGSFLSGLLRISGGILTLPLTGKSIFGVALGNTMINRGLKELNKGYEKREKIVYDFKYTDIAYKISEVKDKVEYTNLIISDNLLEINKLKDNFNKYNEYNNVLPEYNEVLEKIDALEQKLRLQQEKLNKMDKKLDEEKKLNQEKMKKVSMYKDR